MSISEVANCDDTFSRTKLDFEQSNKRQKKRKMLLWSETKATLIFHLYLRRKESQIIRTDTINSRPS